ncbi:InlB B-repeat-containing protein [Pseudoflavonifractor capillosus]|uniref:InlB B-repeat-containing protein n=1 Tax=Pseudoflavonifractor capillosus TaxID=106588 RepID=UPI0019586C23|nr:InlB B-repeat-containing protein [Pseudoflavonifractor capillosus]MBM6693686.1 InlB B-repeat-containing protein [Pseudoflavonifractor capillosus]
MKWKIKLKRKQVISLLVAVVLVFCMCASNTMTKAGNTSLATLTINYYLEKTGGNMVCQPYIAQQVVGSRYEVSSPAFANFTLIDPEQSVISGVLEEDTTVSVFYTYTENMYDYTVVYEGYDPSTGETEELDRVVGQAPAATKIPIEYKQFNGYLKDVTEEMSLTVTADGKAKKILTYTKQSDPYIIFTTYGTYVEPILAPPGTNIEDKLSGVPAPERAGYSFDCWYTLKEGVDPEGWTWNPKNVAWTAADGQELAERISTMPEQDLVVYAHWVPKEVEYTVVVWFEDLDGDYVIHSNNETRKALTESTVTASEQDIANGDNDAPGGEFFGFDYSHSDDTVVAGDGTSVLNLYYNREEWTVTLHNADGSVWKVFKGNYGDTMPEDFPDYQEYADYYNANKGSETGDFKYLYYGTIEDRKLASPSKFTIQKSWDLYPYYSEDDMKVYNLYTYNQSVDGESYEHYISEVFVEKHLRSVGLEYVEGFDWAGGDVYISDVPLSATDAEIRRSLEDAIGAEKWEKIEAYWPSIYEVNENGILWCYLGYTTKGNPLEHTGGFREFNYFYRNRVQSDLTYVSNGQVVGQETDIYYEAPITLMDAPTNMGEGYEFLGWYTDPELMNLTNPVEDGYEMPATDLTLYAKWERKDLLVQFDSQGGSPVESQSVAYNTSAEEPQEPTRAGYQFMGWYTKKVGGERWTFDRLVAEDTTLYARWESVGTAPYTINHIIQGEKTPFYQETGVSSVGDTIYAKVLLPQNEHYPDDIYLVSEIASRTMVLSSEEENTVTFVYQQVEETTYTVSYLEEGTNRVLAEDKQVSTRASVVTEIPVNIKGYVCTNLAGYETITLVTSWQPVSTLGEGQENHITFYYREGGAELSFIKVDGSGFDETNVQEDDLLSGAQFQLYGYVGSQWETHAQQLLDVSSVDNTVWKNVGMSTSQSDGKTMFVDLLPGNYRLVETKAPDGYQLPKGQWNLIVETKDEAVVPQERAEEEIKIDLGEFTLTITAIEDAPAFMIDDHGVLYLVNYHPIQPPITGGRGIAERMLLGGAMMLGGGGLALLWFLQNGTPRRKSKMRGRSV